MAAQTKRAKTAPPARAQGRTATKQAKPVAKPSASKKASHAGKMAITSKAKPEAVTKPQSAKTVAKPQSAGSVAKPQSAGSVAKPQSAQAVAKAQSPKAVAKPQGTKESAKPQSAITAAKPPTGPSSSPAAGKPVVKGASIAKGLKTSAAKGLKTSAAKGSGDAADGKRPLGERRRLGKPAPLPFRNYQLIGVPSLKGTPIVSRPTPPPPPPPPPKPATLEERVATVHERLEKQSEEFRRVYFENFDMSWIYHDSALEGVVYSFQELKTAVATSQTIVQESSMQPVVEEIRRHKAAIEMVREHAKKRLPITVDVVKKIYLVLHPEEGDLKTVKYRKDIPQHRLYFHEYAPPDKIAYKVRQVVDWINDPETKRGRNAIRIAARAHYDLLRVFPFATDSGKVARLLMNLLLMRAGYEPAIVHSTERQRYYEALKGSAATILNMVAEAEENGLASVEKLLDEHDSKSRSFGS
jgi:Fic family protein